MKVERDDGGRGSPRVRNHGVGVHPKVDLGPLAGGKRNAGLQNVAAAVRPRGRGQGRERGEQDRETRHGGATAATAHKASGLGSGLFAARRFEACTVPYLRRAGEVLPVVRMRLLSVLVIAAFLAGAMAQAHPGHPPAEHRAAGEERSEERSLAARESAQERREFQESQRSAREACADDPQNRSGCMQEVRDRQRAYDEARRAEHAQAVEGAGRAARMGHFETDGDLVAGRHVSFVLDAENGTLRDLAVSGALVAEAVTVADAGAFVATRLHGGALALEWQNATVHAHDNPALALRIRADAGGRIAFAEGLNLTEENGTVLAEGPGLRATLAAANATIEGNAVAFDARAHLVVHARNPLLPEAANLHREEIERAKGKGKVGAEITVLGGDAVDVAVLEDVTLAFDRRADALRFVVGASGIPGQTFVINVDRGVLRADDLSLRYFDEVGGEFVEVPIVQAQGGLADCLDATDDSTPEYCVVRGPDGWQVLVSVNHWSVHAIEIAGVAVPAPPSALAGLVGAFALSGVAAYVLFRRR